MQSSQISDVFYDIVRNITEVFFTGPKRAVAHFLQVAKLTCICFSRSAIVSFCEARSLSSSCGQGTPPFRNTEFRPHAQLIEQLRQLRILLMFIELTCICWSWCLRRQLRFFLTFAELTSICWSRL
ncbi:hypothetical protein V5799_024527 [Amblyomma americanum]|uniref:Uncharacterized protein n=1 Tax=Amblyomma americanum TaxID=6943 RepID=A0AAQ4EBT3_AMBAM